ncbi:hypothetical protein [Fibrobacter sp. UWP2]|nr:hypothetical protein [Fibrobacter sp. UWP2]
MLVMKEKITEILWPSDVSTFALTLFATTSIEFVPFLVENPGLQLV